MQKWGLINLKQGQQTFFWESQLVNIIDFAGHKISVPITQFCQWSMEVTIDNPYTNEHGCVPKQLYLQKHMDGLWVDLVSGP